MQPKVTVITPTHNRQDFLKIAMQSVLACGYDNLQYIIVDDASRDGTKQVVESFQSQHPGKITYLYNEKNLGESGSINRGWSKAEGDYIVTLSDDDIFLPNWFEHSVSFMEKNPAAIVGYPDWYKIDDNGNVLYTIHMPEYDFVRLFTTCANMPGPGVIIRRSLIADKSYLREEKYIFTADYEMWLVLATYAPFVHIPHITASWRYHEESTTCKANGNEKSLEMDYAICRFVDKYRDSPLIQTHHKKIKARTFLHIAYVLFRTNNVSLAIKYVLRAFMESPYWLLVLGWCYVARITSRYFAVRETNKL